MKNYLLLLALCLFLQTTLGAQTSSSCQPDSSLRTNYAEDVKNIALGRINHFNAPEKSKVEISQIWQDTVWEGLAAIYHSHSSFRDDVLDIYCIHKRSGFTSAIFKTIDFNADSSTTWIQHLINSNNQSGIPTLDSILNLYQFKIKSVFYFGYTVDVAMTTPFAINVQPIIDYISSIPGVNYADKSSLIGDGDDILYEKNGSVRFYSFYLKWGDCPSGCTGGSIWKFKVNSDCSVEFVNYISSDPVIPVPPVNCHITASLSGPSGEIFETSISPNPVTDRMTVRSAKWMERLEWYNALGVKVHSAPVQGNLVETTLPANMPAGWYALAIWSRGNQVEWRKILRE
jgi:hypothetical protein